MESTVFESDLWHVWQTAPSDETLSFSSIYCIDQALGNASEMMELEHSSFENDTGANAVNYVSTPLCFPSDLALMAEELGCPELNPMFICNYSGAVFPTSSGAMAEVETSASTEQSSLNSSFSSSEYQGEDVIAADLRRSFRKAKPPRTEPDFIYTDGWREGTEYVEFKGLGLSPKKTPNQSKKRVGHAGAAANTATAATDTERSRSPVVDALLKCAALGMGARVATWSEENVEIFVSNTERLLRAVAYACNKTAPTSNADYRLKTIRRWFDGMPSKANNLVQKRYIIKARNDTEGNRAKKLLVCAERLGLIIPRTLVQ